MSAVPSVITNPTPANLPIDGPKLIQEIREFIRRYVFLKDECP